MLPQELPCGRGFPPPLWLFLYVGLLLCHGFCHLQAGTGSFVLDSGLVLQCAAMLFTFFAWVLLLNSNGKLQLRMTGIRTLGPGDDVTLVSYS